MCKKQAWWLVGVVFLIGCVPSMHAIYTDKDLVFNPEFVGVWQQGNSPETWKFDQRDAKSYRLVYTDREGHQGSFIAHLADIEGTQFLDLYPEQTGDATPSFHQIHHVSIHTIYLVKRTDGPVILATIDYPWLEKYIKDHPTKMPSAPFGSHRMLTASTEQLQRFLIDNKDRFIHDLELRRIAP